MKQISRIIIQNFQCHKNTVIKLAEKGLTVITGPTDHGKSAMVRAIRWLFQNRPLGDDFIRHGAKECIVRVELVDGNTVARRRTTSLNQYYINDELFEGFGNEVPLEVQQALGVYSYDVADETLMLNIAKQLSGPFLGSSITAPTRAKILGKLAGTEAIDKADKNLGTDIYHAKQDKKKLKTEINEKQEEINEYSWVQPLGEILDNVEDKINKLEKKEEKLDKLKDIKSNLDEVNYKKKKYYDYLNNKLMHLDHLAIKISTIEYDMKELKEFKKINNKLWELQAKETNFRNHLDKLFNLDKAQIKLQNIINKNNKINRLSKMYEKHLSLIQQRDWLEEDHNKLKDATNANQLYNNMTEHIEQVEDMNYLLQNLVRNKKKKEILQDRLNKVENVPRAWEVINNIETLKKWDEEQKELLDHYKDIKSSINHLRDKKRKYTQMKQQVIKKVKLIKKKYHNLLDQLGICPTCGAKSEDQELEKVI